MQLLLITNAEQLRKHNMAMRFICKRGGCTPVVKTYIDDGIGNGSRYDPYGQQFWEKQETSLHRWKGAVIGGLILASTFAALFILPLLFAWGQGKTSTQSVSLDPER